MVTTENTDSESEGSPVSLGRRSGSIMFDQNYIVIVLFCVILYIVHVSILDYIANILILYIEYCRIKLLMIKIRKKKENRITQRVHTQQHLVHTISYMRKQSCSIMIFVDHAHTLNSLKVGISIK